MNDMKFSSFWEKVDLLFVMSCIYVLYIFVHTEPVINSSTVFNNVCYCIAYAGTGQAEV